MEKTPFKNKLLKIVKVVAVLLLCFSAVSVYFYLRITSYKPPVPATPQGVFFEQLLPAETIAVLSFNPSDATQRRLFNNLLETVLQDKKDAVLPFLASKFLSEERDINSLAKFISLIKTDFRGAIALTNGKEKSGTLIMLALKNPDEMKDVLKKGKIIVEKKEVLLAEYEKMYAGVIEDVFFWADSQPAAQEVITTFKQPWHALTNVAEFKDAMKNTAPPFSGYAFLNTKPGGSAEIPSIGKINNANFDVISHAIAVYSAGEDGIYADTVSFVKEAGYSTFGKFTEQTNISINGKVSAEKLVTFLEVHGVGEILLEQAMKSVVGNSKDKKLSDDELQKEAYAQLNKTTGFNFKNEIMPLIKENFAFSMHDFGDNMPAVTLTFDVNGQEQIADEFIKKLDQKVEQLISLANLTFKTNEKEQIITLEKLQTAKAGGLVKIYLNRISKEIANIPLFAMLPSPVELAYGLTENGLLFFSTTPNFGKIFVKTNTIRESEVFAQAMAKTKGTGAGNLFILDSANLLGLIQCFIDLAKKDGKFSKDDEATYEMIKKYVSPIKSAVQFSQGDGENIKGKVFIKIAK